MPLEEKCRNAVGRNLHVQPYYGTGWGWLGVRQLPPDYSIRNGPPAFTLLVDKMLELENQIIGVRGKVFEPGHQYNGCWCLACLRLIDEFNFEEKPGHYMIWIAQNEPHFLPSVEKAIFEYVSCDKSEPCLFGYGTISEFQVKR